MQPGEHGTLTASYTHSCWINPSPACFIPDQSAQWPAYKDFIYVFKNWKTQVLVNLQALGTHVVKQKATSGSTEWKNTGQSFSAAEQD